MIPSIKLNHYFITLIKSKIISSGNYSSKVISVNLLKITPQPEKQRRMISKCERINDSRLFFLFNFPYCFIGIKVKS